MYSYADTKILYNIFIKTKLASHTTSMCKTQIISKSSGILSMCRLKKKTITKPLPGIIKNLTEKFDSKQVGMEQLLLWLFFT